MNIFGLRIAKENKTVKSKISNDLIYSSEFGAFPIFREETFSINQNQGISSTRKKHGLNFFPFVLAFSKSSEYPGKWFRAPYAGSNGLTNNTTVVTSIQIDKENIRFGYNFGNGVAGEIITIKYYIFDFPIVLSV